MDLSECNNEIEFKNDSDKLYYWNISKTEDGRFSVRWKRRYKKKVIGTFDTLNEAIDAYDQEIFKLSEHNS